MHTHNITPTEQPATFTIRRRLLRLLAAGVLAGGGSLITRSLRAEEVKWLKEVQRLPDPQRASADDAGIPPLLVDDNGQPIRTWKEWQQHRMTLRQRWMEFLGPMPEKRPAVKLEVLREESFEGGTRQRVRYENEPAEFVEGYLLLPEGVNKSSPRAGIVGLHQTTQSTIDEIAGVSGRDSMQIGLKLCQRGFVVFCPECFLWRGEGNYNDAVDRFRSRHPRTLGMHKMLYDAMRGVDVLASLPEVDTGRLGACGHSLGGKETLYLAAFDDRIRAAVASEGGLEFDSTNWDAPWYLGKGIHAEDFTLNHAQLLALTAPRALLILGGESGRGAADGDRNWPLIEAARKVYALHDGPIRLGMFNHRKGHSIPEEAFEKMATWLETYLGK